LFVISDELGARDAAERARALAHYQALDADERARRRALDYTAEHEVGDRY
jgi:hypothetical protein